MDPLAEPKNLRTEQKTALKQANIAWSQCLAKNFVPQWLSGANLNVTEVCTEELAKLQELDAEVYPNGLPFKTPKNLAV